MATMHETLLQKEISVEEFVKTFVRNSFELNPTDFPDSLHIDVQSGLYSRILRQFKTINGVPHEFERESPILMTKEGIIKISNFYDVGSANAVKFREGSLAHRVSRGNARTPEVSVIGSIHNHPGSFLMTNIETTLSVDDIRNFVAEVITQHYNTHIVIDSENIYLILATNQTKSFAHQAVSMYLDRVEANSRKFSLNRLFRKALDALIPLDSKLMMIFYKEIQLPGMAFNAKEASIVNRLPDILLNDLGLVLYKMPRGQSTLKRIK